MKEKTKWIKRLIPLFILLLVMGFVYFTELYTYISFEVLKKHRQTLKDFVDSRPLIAPLAFIVIYATSTALSIPGGLFLSIFGGFLFPQPFSTIYVLVGATLGAICIFLIAKTALGDYFRAKAGGKLKKMQDGFQENAANYLLFLRLVPLFPFWLVNIAPAFFRVSLITFTWTTFVGIIPGAFAFTQAGVGLGTILDKGDTSSFDTILNTDVKIALIALGLFAILPVIIKKFRKKKND